MRIFLKNQKGTTLIELLLSLVIASLLMGVILKMFQVAVVTWQSASRLSNLTNNTFWGIELISTEIREATTIAEVKSDQIQLMIDGFQIRYSIHSSKAKLQVIREIFSPQKGWQQYPYFPIAQLEISASDTRVLMSFQQILPGVIGWKIQAQNYILQSSALMRCF